ncbi:hypothetical protein SCLCIDRAFT_990895 [Scleroderma citrinum Foug A]|uniref:Uncharacterized protein n=1 Tax=Scleroderma citrinum Foug A TaxID=1036808 RepID=A0A0C3DTZ0_9AGAM|nr:hypothetical protein SCLCIDRAFT_990895 [Scleroderma citrinum Foug A]
MSGVYRHTWAVVMQNGQCKPMERAGGVVVVGRQMMPVVVVSLGCCRASVSRCQLRVGDVVVAPLRVGAFVVGRRFRGSRQAYQSRLIGSGKFWLVTSRGYFRGTRVLPTQGLSSMFFHGYHMHWILAREVTYMGLHALADSRSSTVRTAYMCSLYPRNLCLNALVRRMSELTRSSEAFGLVF